MSRLAILGASGHGKVVADTAELCGWSDISFFDDIWPKRLSTGSWEVVGTGDDLLKRLSEFDGVVVAIGNNKIRERKISELFSHNAALATLIHPSASVSRYADVGVGTVIFAGAVLHAGATVGVGCILNTGCSVDHDCCLANAVHISPGARLAGDVRVGARSWVGIGSSVRQMITLGEDVVVGVGAAVVADVMAGITVIGVPARPLN
ncbi:MULTISPECIES: acetyltransferase [unclassified Pseudomonas]|uniref:acetyltransferase n=1 Tax=unclassified Pseudomonas TaxID=196821 RepID=UPI000F790709|nr:MULTISPECIES: acetyltransferase [unclassified Pseudomonas]RRV44848.1 acetyltransferase [Pseudomonas sp. p106]HDS1758574.1 acetyltransferase [Pseudomonas putida]